MHKGFSAFRQRKFTHSLCTPSQVVVLNKIDLDEVGERRHELETALKKHMGHTRCSHNATSSSFVGINVCPPQNLQTRYLHAVVVIMCSEPFRTFYIVNVDPNTVAVDSHSCNSTGRPLLQSACARWLADTQRPVANVQ